jgi:hypothetical protein
MRYLGMGDGPPILPDMRYRLGLRTPSRYEHAREPTRKEWVGWVDSFGSLDHGL